MKIGWLWTVFYRELNGRRPANWREWYEWGGSLLLFAGACWVLWICRHVIG